MTAVASIRTIVNAEQDRFPPAGNPVGSIPFSFAYSLLEEDFTHADDATVVCGPFPAVAYIKNTAGAVSLDLGALISSADLDFSFGFGTAAGAITHELFIGTSLGEGAALNYPSAAQVGEGGWIDVGGMYFVINIATASADASGAAGVTATVYGEYTQNVNLALEAV